MYVNKNALEYVNTENLGQSVEYYIETYVKEQIETYKLF